MRSKKNRDLNIFSASVVDLFASGMGVFLIVSILALVNQKKNEQKIISEHSGKIEDVLKKLEFKKAEILKLKSKNYEKMTAQEKINLEKQKKNIEKSFSIAEAKIETIKAEAKIKTLQVKMKNLEEQNKRLLDKIIKSTSNTFGFDVGKKFRLKNVHFYPGTSDPIEPYASMEVEALALRISELEVSKVEVSGHIYQSKKQILSGRDSDPTDLSGARARKVCEMLISFGVSPRILHCVGYGAKKYLYLTNEPISKEAQMNRRVDVEIFE